MNRIVQFDSLEAFQFDEPKSVHLAIGMFDGVHLGHQRVLESALQRSAEEDGVAGVLTFWPHPSRLFNPESPVRMILTPELKASQFALRNMRFVIEESFTEDFSNIEAESFIKHLVRRIPGLKSIHTGLNWRFGKGGRGDPSMLELLAKEEGIEAHCAEVHLAEGERVSSTRIRSLLTEGSVEKVNELLGYNYFSVGTAIQGKQLGSEMGTPTLNMPFEGDLRPAYGVYVTLVSDLSSNIQYKSVSNFGVRPTVEKSDKPLLETHFLEECSFSYGARLRVEWLEFIRPEREFANVDELRNRIREDVQIANRRFEMI